MFGFGSDYSSDLEKEQTIGVITNGVLFFQSTSRGSGLVTYTPYNLIFTKNFIFGQNLGGNKNTIKIWGIELDNPTTFDKFIKKGSISKQVPTDPQSKIDIKWSYKSVKKATVEINNSGASAYLKALIIPNTPTSIVGTCLVLEMGLFNKNTFIFGTDLIDEMKNLLSKTELVDRLISK